MNKRFIIICLLSALLLALLFAVMRPIPPLEREALPEAASQPSAQAVAPVSDHIEFVIREGAQPAPQIHQVTEGQTVAIKLSSDQDDELHIHGYDLKAQVAAGKTIELRFNARHTGRFEMELHESHRVLGVLEVLPK